MAELDESLRRAIESFIIDTNDLYFTKEVYPETLVDPAEYMDYCKVCGKAEREHEPLCLFYPLWMAM